MISGHLLMDNNLNIALAKYCAGRGVQYVSVGRLDYHMLPAVQYNILFCLQYIRSNFMLIFSVHVRNNSQAEGKHGFLRFFIVLADGMSLQGWDGCSICR